MKKIITALVRLVILSCIIFTPRMVFALEIQRGQTQNQDKAKTLNELGLYKGISQQGFEPDLGSALDRQTGIVMLLRLFGQEKEALAMSEKSVEEALSKFTDKGSISDWAKNSVAYAVGKGLVKGTSSTTLKPKSKLVARDFYKLLLQQLGYEPSYDNAPEQLAQVGGITPEQAAVYGDKPLIKDDLVGISYGALLAKDSNGGTVIENLVNSNVVKAETAIKVGLGSVKITSIEKFDDITVSAGEKVELPRKVKATYNDGTTKEVAVEWSKQTLISMLHELTGSFTILGKIDGTDLVPEITFIVKPIEQSPKKKERSRLHNDYLQNLTISSGSLDPAFDLGTYSYNVDVPFDIDSLTVTANADSSEASMEYFLNNVKSESSSDLELNVGANTIKVVVRAEAGNERTYNINVTRAAPSDDAKLASLEFSEGELDQDFSSDIYAYTLNLTSDSSITVCAQLSNEEATMEINDESVTSGEEYSVDSTTVSVITIHITAEDGVTEITYTVTVDVEPPPGGGDAKLMGLSVGSETLTPNFDPETEAYTVSTSSATISINAMTSDQFATMKLHEYDSNEIDFEEYDLVNNSDSDEINLEIGSNILKVIVTAEDNVTTKTYTITVQRN